MKNAVRLFAKVAMFCMIAGAFFSTESFAQTAQPHNGEIYYYKENLGEYTYYMAVQFVDGGIRFLTSSLMENESLQKFKTRAPKELSKEKMIKYDHKTKDNQYVYSFSMESEDYGFFEEGLIFTNNYNNLLYFTEDEFEGITTSDFELIR